jgi:predicted secreted protein
MTRSHDDAFPVEEYGISSDGYDKPMKASNMVTTRASYNVSSGLMLAADPVIIKTSENLR